eukprot:1159548-Pelagomonas_calceolata.AAC.20
MNTSTQFIRQRALHVHWSADKSLVIKRGASCKAIKLHTCACKTCCSRASQTRASNQRQMNADNTHTVFISSKGCHNASDVYASSQWPYSPL